MSTPPINLAGLKLDRRHLHYFVVAADSGGFSAAAKALYVAPTAIARAMSQLERRLGVTLFIRSPGGSILTPEGTAILGPARRALQALNDVAAAAYGSNRLDRGHLEISALPTLTVDIVGPLVGEFHRRFPHIEVTVRNPGRQYIGSILEGIEDGSAHIGLTEGIGMTSSLFRVTELATLRVWALLPPEAAVRDPTGLTVAQVAQNGLVIGELWESSMLYTEIKRRLSSVNEYVTMRTAHRDSIIDLVCAGVGAAFADERTARSAKLRGAVTAPVRPALNRHLVAVSLASHTSPTVSEFHSVCRDFSFDHGE